MLFFSGDCRAHPLVTVQDAYIAVDRSKENGGVSPESLQCRSPARLKEGILLYGDIQMICTKPLLVRTFWIRQAEVYGHNWTMRIPDNHVVQVFIPELEKVLSPRVRIHILRRLVQAIPLRQTLRKATLKKCHELLSPVAAFDWAIQKPPRHRKDIERFSSSG